MSHGTCSRIAAALVAGWVCAGGSAPAAVEADLIIDNATVIDMTGAPARPGTSIAIAGERIVAVGSDPEIEPVEGARRIDAGGAYAIPGLSDLHVHVGLGGQQATTPAQMDRALRQFLYYGVTDILVVGGTGGRADQINAFRRRIGTGALNGPTVRGTGSMLTLPGSHPAATIMRVPDGVDRADYDWRRRGVALVETDDQARAVVREHFEAGMDAIKIVIESGPPPYGDDHPQMPPAMVAAIVNEADSVGLPVLAHASTLDELVVAIDNGVHAVMHAVGMPFPGGEVFRRMAEREVYYVPTLSLYAAVMGSHWSAPGATEDRFLHAGVDAATLASLADWQPMMAGMAPPAQANLWRGMLDSIARAQAAGVPIALGTDTNNPYVFPGYSAHLELELLVEAGLTPMQALIAGTRTAARMLGRAADAGTLAPGKRADVLLLSENPLNDIRATRTLHTVIRSGRVVDRDALLAEPAGDPD